MAIKYGKSSKMNNKSRSVIIFPERLVKKSSLMLVKSQKQNERLTTLVGKVTVEKEWLAKKLKSLGLSNRKPLVELYEVHIWHLLDKRAKVLAKKANKLDLLAHQLEPDDD
jgi:hypothetical protein